ncbi:hypothetical protein [Pseudoduganella sp. OTU4001]|uniref:hypothetical protein n=1 Tax=Pseudoduganella sp. OTU4001 TaxID=3043854 RepID=UPI00313EF8C6
MSTRTAGMLMISLALASGSVFAGPDESMRVAQRMAAAAKQKLAAAEAAKGAEQRDLMAQHMKMMEDAINQMRSMKPPKEMSMQEHEQWIAEHQALMQQMMEQMLSEHRMMKDACRTERH